MGLAKGKKKRDEDGAIKRRWCVRCQCNRHFKVRVRPDGRRQSDCIACARRRGRARSPEMITYKCMLDRCFNSSAVNFKYYGGRGITVCDRWRGPEGFANFLRDMGPRPAGRTLDRIDPDGNYEPSNCRWATHKTQMENKRADGGVDLVNVKYGPRKKKNYQQARQG